MEERRILENFLLPESVYTLLSSIGIAMGGRYDYLDHISHGVLVIVGNEGLFLQMASSYEYKCILHGEYNGYQLSSYLRTLSQEERTLLLEHPFIQWRKIYARKKMPGPLYRRLRNLQRILPDLYRVIPVNTEKTPNLCLPKGRAYRTETSVQAAIRELREETGISVTASMLTPPYVERQVGSNGSVYTTCVYAVYLRERPRITLSREFKGYMWLSPNDGNSLFSHLRLLSTFLPDVNEFSCDSGWLQSLGQARDDQPAESAQESSASSAPSAATAPTDDHECSAQQHPS